MIYGMVKNRREIDMELKKKENINMGFTFQKRVIEETLELLGRKRNYIDNDVRFMAMIAFCNNLVENNIIIETLYDETNIVEKVETIIEPFFEEEVINKPTVLEIFYDIVNQITRYMEREYASRNYITGFVYDIAEELGDLSPEGVEEMLKSIMELFPMKASPIQKREKKQEKTDADIKADVLQDIENLKMKALMEKFIKNNPEQEENAE